MTEELLLLTEQPSITTGVDRVFVGSGLQRGIEQFCPTFPGPAAQVRWSSIFARCDSEVQITSPFTSDLWVTITRPTWMSDPNLSRHYSPSRFIHRMTQAQPRSNWHPLRKPSRPQSARNSLGRRFWQLWTSRWITSKEDLAIGLNLAPISFIFGCHKFRCKPKLNPLAQHHRTSKVRDLPYNTILPFQTALSAYF